MDDYKIDGGNRKRGRTELLEGAATGGGLRVGPVGGATSVGQFMNPVMIASLRYADLTTVAAGTPFSQSYRLNSLFDTDATNAGHQPMGFDQISAVYGQYLVEKVDVSLRFTPPDGGTALSVVTVVVSQSAIPPTSMSSCIEAGAPWFVVRGGMGNPPSTKFTIDLHKVEGITLAEYRARVVTYGAASTASPSDMIYMHIQSWQTAMSIITEFEFHSRFLSEAYANPS